MTAGGVETPPTIGESVAVRNVLCTVRFVGPTNFADGVWVGVEFPTACGRNDGSVEGTQYFKCTPRHGLFVRIAQVQPASEANPRIEREAPEAHVGAWAAMENVLEAEALRAGREGDRVLSHLESQHPKAGGQRRPVGVPAGSSGGRIKRRARTDAGGAGGSSGPEELAVRLQ